MGSEDPIGRPELGSDKFTRWWTALKPAVFSVVGISMILLDWGTGGVNLAGLSGLGAAFCGITLVNIIDRARVAP